MKNECPHLEIEVVRYPRGVGSVWKCVWCGQKFIPEPEEHYQWQPPDEPDGGGGY